MSPAFLRFTTAVAVVFTAGCIQNPADIPAPDVGEHTDIDDGATGGDCGGEEVLCGDPADGTAGCVDPDTDPDHCGGCDNRCEAPVGALPVCDGGSCTTVCDAAGGFASCTPDEECTDLNSNPDHCGRCDRACPTGECDGGRCAPFDCDPGAEPFGGGDGTPSNPHTICSAAHLVALAELESPSEVYALSADIDLEETEQFEPIGAFSGVFDGFGFTIRNLQLTAAGEAVGLFAHVTESGRIREVNLRQFNVHNESEDDEHRTGALTGLNDGVITGVRVVDGEVEGHRRVGGVVGQNRGRLQGVETRAVTADGEARIGGVAGLNNGFVGESHAQQLRVQARQGEVGGLVGRMYDGEIRHSSAAGIVDAPDADRAGGLVGLVHHTGSVGRSFAEVAVHAHSRAGGLVGELDHPDTSVEDCYSTGAVDAETTAGGIAGHLQGRIERCYTIAAVEDAEATGGLAGAVEAPSDTEPVAASFWHADYTGQPDSPGGGEARDTETFGEPSFFDGAGWDLDTTWYIPDDEIEDSDFARPRLRWERGRR